MRLAFPYGASPKQRQAVLNAAIAAARAGVPYPFMAAAVVSSNETGLPWERIDGSMKLAKDFVAALNRTGEKRFQDLAHVVAYAAEGGNSLPKTVQVGLRMQNVAGFLRTASVWPASSEAVPA